MRMRELQFRRMHGFAIITKEIDVDNTVVIHTFEAFLRPSHLALNLLRKQQQLGGRERGAERSCSVEKLMF